MEKKCYNIDVKYNAVMYGAFLENQAKLQQELYWMIICTIVTKTWKTRCVTIPGEAVFKQIITELKRQRTLDIRQKRSTPWHLIKL